MKNLMRGLICLALVESCTHHPTPEEIVAPGPMIPAHTETVSIEAKQVAAEQQAEFVAELKFKPKENDLSVKNKKRLDALLKKADHSIREIKVISWADERNQAIKGYLESRAEKVKIKTYNMATRTSAWKEFLGTSEVRLKKSLGNTPTSKAIIMIVTE